jgi:hypothetical protein
MYQLINRIFLKFIIRSGLNVKVGRKLFCNDGGVISNVIGRYVKNRDSKNSKKLGFHCNQSPFVEDLKDRGFAVVDRTASEAAMASLAETWARWASDQETPKDGRLQLSSVDFSETVNECLPMLRQLVTKEVEDTLESYFGSYSRIINFHIYRNTKALNVSRLDSYGSTGHWHTDGSTSESIKLFFMLSDVNVNNGPMEIISRKDTRKVFQSTKFSFPDKKGQTVRYIGDECKIISLQGKRGSSFYALTNDILHRATVPDEGEFRDLIVFYITSSSIKRPIEQQLKEAKYSEIYGLKRLGMN